MNVCIWMYIMCVVLFLFYSNIHINFLRLLNFVSWQLLVSARFNYNAMYVPTNLK